MRRNRLPVMICHATCPKCGLPTDEFRMFESGLGGDFETYVGRNSGSLYRLDLGQVHYQGKSRSDLLAEAIEAESELTLVPNELRCKICGAEFSATNIPIDGEETVEAYEI